MCSPALTTFLTGLIPSQHGLRFILDPKFTMGPEAYIWPANEMRFFNRYADPNYDFWKGGGSKAKRRVPHASIPPLAV